MQLELLECRHDRHRNLGQRTSIPAAGSVPFDTHFCCLTPAQIATIQSTAQAVHGGDVQVRASPFEAIDSEPRSGILVFVIPDSILDP